MLASDKSSLIALWVEAMFHGIYTVLFVGCLYVLIYMRTARTTRRVIVAAVVLMYLLCSGHMAVILARAYLAFTKSEDIGGPKAFYMRLNTPLNLAQQALFVVSGIVADCLLIFRCFIIYEKSLIACALPALLLVASIVCGGFYVHAFTLLPPGQVGRAAVVSLWLRPYICISFATNVIVTALIAYRIIHLTRRMTNVWDRRSGPGSSSGSSIYSTTILAVIESGALYSASLLIFLAVYESGTNAQAIPCQAMAQIVGIAPTLIVVQIGLGLSVEKTRSSHSHGTSTEISVQMPVRHQHVLVISDVDQKYPRGMNSEDSYAVYAGK
ncbi:hypothetical protein EXIGLDRAFT_763232 [Exidia glandulosa HHB12029]|uniref:Uncharacterized protein n=1 Tax=Exidia glandulosa HHB12029 TaxID=1314781 RepID=A0A165M4N4_EXIGL|nr:hypothetical protein EXIGLDRAFT_763232 [Exidia glandulosa HHB12029]